MKKLLLIMLLLISAITYSQDEEGDDRSHKHHRKNYEKNEHYKKNNYFTLGLFTGTYIGRGPVKEANGYLNSISLEAEYFKFKDLSLVVSGTYQFSRLNSYDLLGKTEGPYFKFNEPYSHKLNISINGRYYLGKEKVKPYLQMGLNQETNFIKDYSTITYSQSQQIISIDNYQRSYTYRYSVNFGVGVNIHLFHKFSFDAKYNLYKTLGRERRTDYYPTSNDGNGFNGFSLLAGIKYRL